MECSMGQTNFSRLLNKKRVCFNAFNWFYKFTSIIYFIVFIVSIDLVLHVSLLFKSHANYKERKKEKNDN